MRWTLCLCLSTLLLTACAFGQGSEAAAAKAKAAWSADQIAAFGFEDARYWDGGETATDLRQAGQAAVRWAKHKTNGGLGLTIKPLDLSAFNTVSFWLHSDKANGETFMIIAESLREPGTNSYFSRKFTVDWTGWKQINAHFQSFGTAREPAGWNKISQWRFTTTGWDQDAKDDAVWVLDELEFSYDPKPYRPEIKVDKYLQEPPREAFLRDLRQGHPRLILLDEDLPRIRKLIADDPRCALWYAKIKADADNLAKQPPRKHELPDGRRLLSISRSVLDRMYTWGLVYRLDHDRKYLDRAWLELQAVLAFPDWNPSHWLDTAEMQHAVAIGYDWFYNDWTDAQRKTIREGLWQLGLRLSYSAYMGVRAEGQQHWPRVTNNWNFVCNGGAGMAAMALLDEMPEECTEVLHSGIQYIQIPLHDFEPDGAWWEGIGYWGYSMRYLLTYFRGLETAFGTDYGFIKALDGKGFSKAGDFPIYLTSPTKGYFNFADSGSGGSGYQHWGFFYLAARYHNPLYLHFQEQGAGGQPENLIYYEPFESDLKVQDADLDRHFRGAEVATMRGSWTDPNAVFCGIKAGRNGIAHAHQDLGSFAYYALGEKWVMDLGTEGQTYQSHKHHLPHHDFYRIRAEGHNTLVFNPQREDSQDKRAPSTITRFESSPSESIAVVDLSKVYPQDAQKVTRGFRMLDERRSLLIQDEITADKDNELWWFAHGDTNTQMTPSADGRSVVMERNGKVCVAKLLSPAGAKFEVLPATPLPTSPNPDIQQKNAGISKLAIHFDQVRNVTISVLLTPRYKLEPDTTADVAVQPIADWKLAPSGPQVGSISVDGQPLDGFSPKVFTYTVEVPAETTAVPAVTAEGGQVTPAKSVPGMTEIRAGETVYRIRFTHPPAPGVDDKPHFAAKPETVGGITVTASRHDGNLPKNVLDNDPETRWSASGETEWIGFDFGQPRKVEAVGISFFSGNQRQTSFSIEVSADGKQWREVWKGQSGGQTADVETFKLKSAQTTQHLRLVCHGNTQNLWNSIQTVTFAP